MSDEVFRISKPKSRFKFWLFGTILIVYSAVLGAGYLIFQTPVFKVKEFNLSADDSLRALIKANLLKNRPWWAKLLAPDNLLFWSPSGLENFQKPTYLADLKLSRDFINKKVGVEFAERRLFGIWCPVFGSQCFWFDKEGVLFAPSPSAEGALIPKVFDVNEKPAALAPEIMDFLGIFPEILIKDKNFQEAEAKISGGPKIYLSLRFKMENLAGVLKKLSKELKWEKLEYIDLRVPNRVYYK